jgi:hypothetical protein
MEMVSKRSWPVPGGLLAEYSKTLQMRRRELDCVTPGVLWARHVRRRASRVRAILSRMGFLSRLFYPAQYASDDGTRAY